MRLYSVDGTVGFSILVRASSADQATDIVLGDAHLWELKWANLWIEEAATDIPEIDMVTEELEDDEQDENDTYYNDSDDGPRRR